MITGIVILYLKFIIEGPKVYLTLIFSSSRYDSDALKEINKLFNKRKQSCYRQMLLQLLSLKLTWFYIQRNNSVLFKEFDHLL